MSWMLWSTRCGVRCHRPTYSVIPACRFASSCSQATQQWKGTRFWHPEYVKPSSTANKPLIRPEYRGLFQLFDKCQQGFIYGKVKEIHNYLLVNRSQIALKEWVRLFDQKLTTKPDKIPIFTNRSHQLSPRAVNLFVEILLHHNKNPPFALFDQFWAPVSKSPLVVEFIPEIVKELCVWNRHPLARKLLLRIDDKQYYESLSPEQSALYKQGLLNGLNGLLYEYFRSGSKFTESKRSPFWKEIYSVINKFNPDIKLYLYPHILYHLHRRVPKFTYLSFFRLFLSRGLDFKSRGAHIFLRNLYVSSDEASQLINNTDKVLQKIRANDNSKNINKERAFSEGFYEFMFRHLSRNQCADETAWLLENIWLNKADSVTSDGHFDPKQTQWRLLIYRAIEIDGIHSAGMIYDLMIEKGIEPELGTMLTIFRGFRLNAMESKCFQVLDMIITKGWTLDRAFCTDFLTLISDRYGPQVVVEYYKNLFPDDAVTNLENTGIQDYLNGNRALIHSNIKLPYKIDPQGVNTSGSSICEPALNVVYRSILNNVEDIHTFQSLYDQYKNFVSFNRRNRNGRMNKISFKVIDYFVSNLCIRLKSKNSIDLANEIYKDSLTCLPFAYDRRPNNTHSALSILCRSHCQSIKHGESSYRPNVEKAIDLVRLSLNYDFLPINGAAFEPIIKYYMLSENDPIIAKKWLAYALKLGAIIKDQDTIQAQLEKT